MTTRKGIALTAAIIGGFVGASFLVYFIPGPLQSEVVKPADPKAELVFAMDRNQAVVDEFQSTFEKWNNNEVNKGGFDERADVAINQVNELIRELRRTSVPEEWMQSYTLYIQALENYKAYFEKTKEYVNYISTQNLAPGSAENLRSSMSESLTKAESLVQQSMDAMP